MVIFHSYVSLPEGSPQNFGANRVNVPKKKNTSEATPALDESL